MRKRRLLLICLAVYVSYPLLAWVFPPCSVGFWRLACASEVAFDAVGMGGSMSRQFLECSLIDRSFSPQLSYRILFRVGSTAAKCHAVAGLRDLNRTLYSVYLDELKKSDAPVTEHWMDMGMSGFPVSLLAKRIEAGDRGMFQHYREQYSQWLHRGEANQSLQPTTTAVIPAAEQPVRQP